MSHSIRQLRKDLEQDLFGFVEVLRGEIPWWAEDEGSGDWDGWPMGDGGGYGDVGLANGDGYGTVTGGTAEDRDKQINPKKSPFFF